MGSESKSRKRRSSPLSDEEESRRNHRKRKYDREEKEEKPRKKKEKSSKKSEDKEKKSKDKRKHKKKKHIVNVDFKEISHDDYFSKNNEFATWLKEEKDIYFSDLSSESAHDLFSSFVKVWNKGKLELRYYDGISSAPRTAHNWKIKSDK